MNFNNRKVKKIISRVIIVCIILAMLVPSIIGILNVF